MSLPENCDRHDLPIPCRLCEVDALQEQVAFAERDRDSAIAEKEAAVAKAAEKTKSAGNMIAGLRSNIADAMKMLADAGLAKHEVEPLVVRVQAAVDRIRVLENRSADAALEGWSPEPVPEGHCEDCGRKLGTKEEFVFVDFEGKNEVCFSEEMSPDADPQCLPIAIRRDAEKKVQEARAWAEKTVAEVVAAREVTCVYCGHKYEDGTPQSQDERLTAHIKVCKKHPMRALEEGLSLSTEALRRVYNAIEHLPDYQDLIIEAVVPAINVGTGNGYDPTLWSAEWPKEEGNYWFYGFRHRPSKEEEPKLYTAQVWKTRDGFAYVSGSFLHPAEGARGFWKKLTDPMLPSEPIPKE